MCDQYKIWVYIKCPNGKILRVKKNKLSKYTTCYCRNECDILQRVSQSTKDTKIINKDDIKHIISFHGEDLSNYPMLEVKVLDEKWKKDISIQQFSGNNIVIKC